MTRPGFEKAGFFFSNKADLVPQFVPDRKKHKKRVSGNPETLVFTGRDGGIWTRDPLNPILFIGGSVKNMT